MIGKAYRSPQLPAARLQVEAGRLQLAACRTQLPDCLDHEPHEILDRLYRSHAAWNEGKFYNPKLDALIDAGGATLNPTKQRAIFRKALDMVAVESGVGISFHVNGIHVAKKNVHGVVVDPQIMLILEKAWLG